jgi:hypothetical protein
MTRKGLAFGAGLALIGSGLGVAPASATDAVNVLLAPKTGTTYNSILQAGITLTANLNANDTDTTDDAKYLVWRIENAGEASISANFNGFASDNTSVGDANQIAMARSTAATAVSPIAGGGDNFSQRFVTANLDFAASQVAAQALDQVGAVAASTSKFLYVSGFEHTDTNDAGGNIVTANHAVAGKSNDLVISTSEITDAVTLNVQAWLDMNGDGVVDYNEEASATQTVTLYPLAQVSATTVVLPSLSRAANSITADVVLNNDINMQEVGDTEIGVVFLKNGVALPVTNETDGGDDDTLRAVSANGAGAAIVPALWNSGTKTLRATDSYWVTEGASATEGNATNMTAGNYTAIAAYVGSNTTADKDVFLGNSSATLSLSDGLVSGVEGAQLAGESSANVVYVDGNATTPDTFAVRAGAASSASFTAQVTKTDGTDAGAADDAYAAANV